MFFKIIILASQGTNSGDAYFRCDFEKDSCKPTVTSEDWNRRKANNPFTGSPIVDGKGGVIKIIFPRTFFVQLELN